MVEVEMRYDDLGDKRPRIILSGIYAQTPSGVESSQAKPETTMPDSTRRVVK